MSDEKSDTEIAGEVRARLSTLNDALRAAAHAGIDCDVDFEYLQFLGSPVPHPVLVIRMGRTQAL